MRPKTSINKPRTVPQTHRRKRKALRDEAPSLSLSLSHTQAQLCSKHNPGSGPTTVWAGLKIQNKINTHEAFELNRYLSVWDLKQKVKWKKNLWNTCCYIGTLYWYCWSFKSIRESSLHINVQHSQEEVVYCNLL